MKIPGRQVLQNTVSAALIFTLNGSAGEAPNLHNPNNTNPSYIISMQMPEHMLGLRNYELSQYIGIEGEGRGIKANGGITTRKLSEEEYIYYYQNGDSSINEDRIPLTINVQTNYSPYDFSTGKGEGVVAITFARKGEPGSLENSLGPDNQYVNILDYDENGAIVKGIQANPLSATSLVVSVPADFSDGYLVGASMLTNGTNPQIFVVSLEGLTAKNGDIIEANIELNQQ
jgi:hypothetical protein